MKERLCNAELDMAYQQSRPIGHNGIGGSDRSSETEAQNMRLNRIEYKLDMALKAIEEFNKGLRNG